MKRVGIGGVLIMEVDQGTPKGDATFGGPLWRNLFQHVCAEAHRLVRQRRPVDHARARDAENCFGRNQRHRPVPLRANAAQAGSGGGLLSRHRLAGFSNAGG